MLVSNAWVIRDASTRLTDENLPRDVGQRDRSSDEDDDRCRKLIELETTISQLAF